MDNATTENSKSATSGQVVHLIRATRSTDILRPGNSRRRRHRHWGHKRQFDLRQSRRPSTCYTGPQSCNSNFGHSRALRTFPAAATSDCVGRPLCRRPVVAPTFVGRPNRSIPVALTRSDRCPSCKLAIRDRRFPSGPDKCIRYAKGQTANHRVGVEFQVRNNGDRATAFPATWGRG